jgi:exonuclease III
MIKQTSGMTIGFWNVNNKNNKQEEVLSDSLVNFTLENSLDILCLAEVKESTITNYLEKVNALSDSDYIKVESSPKARLVVLSRFSESTFTDKSDIYLSDRMVSYAVDVSHDEVTKIGKIKFNLIVIHFHAKNYWSNISQSMECVSINQNIKEVEKQCGNENTIVIGDFNMNPYESGMVAANGFHAISDLEYIKKNNGRKVANVDYPFFYNPMWNFLGDFKKPQGTFYYRESSHVSYEWHIFDQVLIRPGLKDYLVGEDYVKILTKIGDDSLVKAQGRPDKELYSDHLPITLTLTV